LDDNSHRITFFQNALKQHKLTVCRHARTAIRALKDTSFDLIFLDHDLRNEAAHPDDENCGSEVARFIADQGIDCPYIILHTENRTGRESMEAILPHSQSIPYGKLKKAGIYSIVKKLANPDS
jgi:CheY-like chemotaxis protein